MTPYGTKKNIKFNFFIFNMQPVVIQTHIILFSILMDNKYIIGNFRKKKNTWTYSKKQTLKLI